MCRQICSPPLLQSLLGSATWERLKGRHGSLSKIFADMVLDLQGKWLGAAENCRKPQETAGNRRKSQEAVSTPFSHLVSPIKCCSKRAENGALDPWSLDLRLGRPRFLHQITPKPFKMIKMRVLGPLDHFSVGRSARKILQETHL